MPTRQHNVTLSAPQRRDLEALISRGAAPARQLARARVLLKADAGVAGRRLSDRQISEAVELSARTIARIRAEFATQGLDRALSRKPPDRRYVRKLDGVGEAKLLELACSPAPAGYAAWSLRLLGARLVELEIVESIARSTLHATLKKTR